MQSASGSLPPRASKPAQSWAPCTGQVTHTGSGGVELKPSTRPGVTHQVRQVLTVLPGRSSQPDPHFLPRQPLAITPAPNPALSYANPASPVKAQHPCCCGCHQPQAGTSPSMGSHWGWQWGCPASQLRSPGPALQLKGPHWLVQPWCPHQCDHPQSSCGEILQCLTHLGCTPQHDPHIHKGLAFFNTEP